MGKATHILFVDDVLLFCFSFKCEFNAYMDILLLYKSTTRMEFNDTKSTLYFYNITDGLGSVVENIPTLLVL
jgi:hypothetical protein